MNGDFAHQLRQRCASFPCLCETNGGQWPVFMLAYRFIERRMPTMPMPMPIRTYSDSLRRARFKEVETVRLFTASGHPWMGLAALVVFRAPLLAGAVYLIVRGSPF